MTRAAIVETLAKDFGAEPESVRGVLEMLDAGLSATYIGRFRRGDSKLTESIVRRLQRRRDELEELDRRRGTILRMLTGTSDKDAPLEDDGTFPEIRACMDRFELEDLFLPHRRPEPEVQLALDRGLGELADRIVAPSPNAKAKSKAKGAAPSDADAGQADAVLPEGEPVADDSTDAAPQPGESPADEAPVATAAEEEQTAPAGEAAAPEVTAPEAQAEDASPSPDAPEVTEAAPAGDEPAVDAPTSEDASPAEPRADAEATEPQAAPDAEAAEAPQPDGEPAKGAAPTTAESEGKPKGEGKSKGKGKRDAEPAHVSAEIPGLKEHVDVTPGLALLCREFVAPDRGVHTEEEALAGALRILSDRLGRSPELRRAVRKALRKNGVLSVRPTGDESRAKRHKALLKLNEPVRQLQGKKLLRIRQAQKDRAVTTTLTLNPKNILPRVHSALGNRIDPEFQPVVDHVSAQALVRRLLPMIEADVRLELKERADEEAMRFLSQHLRQVLLAPVGGRRSIAGVATNPKMDWILVVVDGDGNPSSAEIKIETRDKDETTLAEELGNALRDTGANGLALASGRGSLSELPKLRACVRALGADAPVFVVNEAGLSNYANSELARKELPDFSVPARTAISIGRRYQDALLELLKVDPRHLGLGMETGLVSKANLRRTLRDTVESAVALVGCDVNEAPERLLRRIPGLDAEAAEKILARRAEGTFDSREDLRASGVLTEAQWVSSVACLRVRHSSEPLDRTSLHPDQYPEARRLIEAAGGTVEDVLGRRGGTKGLRRADFGIDEPTWRDLIREISFPGRDPRLRLFPPALLAPDTDPSTLEKDQVVEGVVTNVSGFGAFVDLGIGREGLVHISEASNRYVRDAREAITVGQVVRARVLDPSGQRITLSLKNVPAFERKRPDRRGPGGGRRRDRDGEGGGKEWPELQRPVRAAQSRRDGLGGSGGGGEGRGKGGRKPGGGGRGKGGFGGKGGGRRGRGQSEDYDADAVKKVQKTSVTYNPFASFFGDRKDSEGDASGE